MRGGGRGVSGTLIFFLVWVTARSSDFKLPAQLADHLFCVLCVPNSTCGLIFLGEAISGGHKAIPCTNAADHQHQGRG